MTITLVSLDQEGLRWKIEEDPHTQKAYLLEQKVVFLDTGWEIFGKDTTIGVSIKDILDMIYRKKLEV